MKYSEIYPYKKINYANSSHLTLLPQHGYLDNDIFNLQVFLFFAQYNK